MNVPPDTVPPKTARQDGAAFLALVLAVSAYLSLVSVGCAQAEDGSAAADPGPSPAAADPAAQLDEPAVPPDPRAPLVDLQRQGRYRDALAALRVLAAENPDQAKRWGLDVLAGDLLERLGQTAPARQAFIDGMADSNPLKDYSRFRLAQAHARSDHPEVATGLITSLVRGASGNTAGSGSDDAIPSRYAAARLLRESIEAGGSCARLDGLESADTSAGVSRQLRLTRGYCLRQDGQVFEARKVFLDLLDERLDDEVGLTAAQRLEEMLQSLRFADIEPSNDERRLLGLAFHQHREFSRAVSYLAPLVASFDGDLADERYDLAYTLVRSRFWQERYAQAAAGFRALAARAGEPRLVARALYQQGRCHELLGEWDRAIATFRRAYRTAPEDGPADNALFGAMRLEFREGREESALELYEILKGRRQWAPVTSRAAFFLAASDLVRGRADRAGGWLDDADRTAGGEAQPELAYWRGRRSELRDDPADAVGHYLRVLRNDPFHPLALDAAARIAEPPLAETARALAERRAASGSAAGLYDAWLLRAGDGQARSEVAHELSRKLAADRDVAEFLTLELVPTEEWPLWRASLDSPAERLLALGLWESGEDALPDHFPIRRPSLAFTRAWLLARAGSLRDSLLVSELMARRAPSALPEPFLPIGLQRLLYPMGHTDVLIRESLGRGIDPFLLAAIVREESRFDHEALSPASARGLTQFILPTATRMARQIGLDPLEPHHLYRPEVALALGAAYLAELDDTFGGPLHPVVVSYNAGPDAARLWRAYSFTDELPEFFTKVGYKETRDYLRKVLSSREHYRQIYGAPVRRDLGQPR